jgi:WhiB family transcriptional regulator, redox-sensing transcriptional regulator
MSNVRRLPGPNADVWDWQMEGLCRGRDSGQFFHPDGERGSARARREMAAKALCQICPVRPECAAQSLSAREPYGVWGGFTEGERLRLLSLGWQDTWHRYRRRVDVGALEAKLTSEMAKGGEVTKTFVATVAKPAPRQAPAREDALSATS